MSHFTVRWTGSKPSTPRAAGSSGTFKAPSGTIGQPVTYTGNDSGQYVAILCGAGLAPRRCGGQGKRRRISSVRGSEQPAFLNNQNAGFENKLAELFRPATVTKALESCQ